MTQYTDKGTSAF